MLSIFAYFSATTNQMITKLPSDFHGVTIQLRYKFLISPYHWHLTVLATYEKLHCNFSSIKVAFLITRTVDRHGTWKLNTCNDLYIVPVNLISISRIHLLLASFKIQKIRIHIPTPSPNKETSEDAANCNDRYVADHETKNWTSHHCWKPTKSNAFSEEGLLRTGNNFRYYI